MSVCTSSWISHVCRRRRLACVFALLAVCACLGVFHSSTFFPDYRGRSHHSYRDSTVHRMDTGPPHVSPGNAFHEGQKEEANQGRESDPNALSIKRSTPRLGNTQAAAASPTLLLFTTWRWSHEKAAVENSVLDTWPRWRPHVQPMLFSDNQTTLERALRHGWLVHHVSRVTCGGMPVLSAMFQSAMDNHESLLYGFANADLLFDDGLNASIHALLHSKEHLYNPSNTIILSKRINVNWPKGFSLNDTSTLKEHAAKGHYPPEGSSDLFITTSSFPWKDVPDLVVGRVAFGMWMVAFARARRVHTIDITPTCTLVHMTTESGNLESHRKPNANCNFETIKSSKMEVNFNCGWIDCSQFITYSDATRKISVVPHDVPKRLCLPCTLETVA